MAFSWQQPQTGLAPTSFSWGQKKPGVIGSFVQGVKSGFLSEFFGSKDRDPKKLKDVPKTFSDVAVKTYSDTLQDTSVRFNRVFDAFTQNTSKLEKAAKTGEAALGIVNIAFAPITSGLTALATVPGFGMPAVVLNSIFAGVGQGSGDAASKALWNSGLSEKTKQELDPLVRETAGLIGMLAAGKAGSVAYTKIRGNMNKTFDTISKDKEIVEAASRDAELEGSVLGKTAEEKYAEYRQKMGYEPYVPDAELPVIPFGSKAKGLPTIQVGGAPKLGDKSFKYEPIKQDFSWNKTAQPEVTQPTRQSLTEPFQPTGALKFKAEAEKRGFTTDEIPFVERQRNVEQWKSSDDFVKASPREALQAYRGEKELPPGVLRNSLEGSLEKYALENRDMALSNELIKSKLGSETARELQTRNRPLSDSNPIQAGREIRQGRQAIDSNPEASVKKEKASVKKIEAPTVDAWKDFIKSLEC